MTLTSNKADTGGFVGHSSVHPEMMDTAREAMAGQIGSLLSTVTSPVVATTLR